MSSSWYDEYMTGDVPTCPKGHPKTPENWRTSTVRGKTRNFCHPCAKDNWQRIKADRKAGRPARRPPYDPRQFPCGHPRTPENIKPSSQGCLTCARLEDSRRQEAWRQMMGKQKRIIDPHQFPCGHPKSEENVTADHRCRECHIQGNRRWHHADQLARRVASQDYRLRNLEQVRALDRQRNKLRPDTELNRLSRRAREEDRRNPETSKYLEIIRRDPCAYCGGPVDTRDHIVPISEGGANYWFNYAPACKGCNSAKGRKSLLGFLLDKRLMLEFREGAT